MKNIFEDIWKSIEIDYNKGLICSERNLQALIHFNLSNTLGSNYQVFIEPKISIDNSDLNNKVPDVIITRHNTVCAIIEIKYVPYSYVRFENDLKKLIKFKRVNTCRIPLLTDPYTGEWNREETFKLDKSHYSMYLVIANKNSDFFINPKDNEIISSFLNLNKTIICEGKISTKQISFNSKRHE